MKKRLLILMTVTGMIILLGGLLTPPIFAYTDNEALQRILKNLIDNAIRHGGDGKYISCLLYTSRCV